MGIAQLPLIDLEIQTENFSVARKIYFQKENGLESELGDLNHSSCETKVIILGKMQYASNHLTLISKSQVGNHQLTRFSSLYILNI